MKTTLKLKEILFRTSLLGSIFNSCISLTHGMEADLGTEAKGTGIPIKQYGLDERLRQQFAQEAAQVRPSVENNLAMIHDYQEPPRLHQAQELRHQQASFSLPEGYYSIMNNGKSLVSTSGKATEMLGHANYENNRNLWYISPTEEKGCYTITRHKNGGEYLSYTTKDAYTEAEVYSNTSCERDGTWRHYVLWHIDPTENGFMLRNYYFPGTGYLG